MCTGLLCQRIGKTFEKKAEKYAQVEQYHIITNGMAIHNDDSKIALEDLMPR